MNELARHLYSANIPEYLEKFPKVKAELIRFEKEKKPDECICCIFLNVRGERPICALDPDIQIRFMYDQRSEGCELDK